MTKDFEELFACLTARNARALVVGGYAVAFHAKPRFTKDIDIFIDASAENVGRVLQALDDFGFGGLGVSYIGRAELIRNKQASGRTQDLADVDALGPS